MSLAKRDLLGGYGLAFAAVAAVQGAVTAGVAFGLSGVNHPRREAGSTPSA